MKTGRFSVLNFLGVALIVILLGCGSEADKEPISIPYDLSAPQTYELAEELHEVSGISATADGRHLLAVHDEHGELYFIDQEGQIVARKPFHKGGDYEDLAVDGRGVFILKSNGNLYHIPDYAADSLTYQTYKPKKKFKDGLEFESLAADTLNHRLLLLVKDGEGRKGKAPVYGFDLKKMDFFNDAVALVDPKAAPKVVVKGKNLRASGMAVHPITGEWFVISSISRILLVTDPSGDGRTSKKLTKKLYPQPEGICFLSDGTLFLTTEGLSKPAKLFRFSYQPNKIVN